MSEGFIPPHGGYKQLLSYQKARIVYQGTVRFCERFLSIRDRTFDQMVQAARSGKQNIVEGSAVSGTSKEAELKLTNVARASLEELLEDYRDFLRNRGFKEWPLAHPYSERVRQLARVEGCDYSTFKKGIEHPDPAISANVMIGLIKITTYLLFARAADLQSRKGLCFRGRHARAHGACENSEALRRWAPGRRKAGTIGTSETIATQARSSEISSN